jgi:hypothetical protein
VASDPAFWLIQQWLVGHHGAPLSPMMWNIPMDLYFFLLVIVSLSCGSLPPVDTSLAQASLATLCMVTALTLSCHIAGRICAQQIRNENLDPLIGAELLERQMTAFRWLGLGIVVLCLGGFGLASGRAPIFNHSFFLQAISRLRQHSHQHCCGSLWNIPGQERPPDYTPAYQS